MHIHVHHMQVLRFIGDGSANSLGHEEFFLPGQWRDTLPAFQGELLVRFRAADFWGENVIHCEYSSLLGSSCLKCDGLLT
jgi:FtsP/CotA-like multicopper oxidase with cupredoxin domain